MAVVGLSSGFIIALFCFSKKGPSFSYSLLSLLYVVSLSDRGKALLKRIVLLLQTPFFMNCVINLSSFEHGFMVLLTFSPLNMGNSAKRHTKKSGGIQNLLYAVLLISEYKLAENWLGTVPCTFAPKQA